MRSSFFLTLLLLLIVTSSCIEEASITLAPEVPQEEEISETETNFTIEGTNLQVNHSYILTAPIPEGEGYIHHLFLTTDDVSADVRLRGVSASFTVSFYSESATDLAGSYTIGGSAFTPGNASAARVYQALDYGIAQNYESFELPEGILQLSKAGDEYVVSFETTNQRWLYEGKGTFRGALQAITPGQAAEAEDLAFQGPNHLLYGDREVGLNHAFLKRRGSFSDGRPRYRLYLSENNVAPDDANLTGRSDLIFFYVDRSLFAEDEGVFSFDDINNDFIGSLIGGIEYAYYCKNMDFTAQQADEDIPVTKGAVVVRNDANGEVQIAFSVEPVSGEAAKGIYRGPVVYLD